MKKSLRYIISICIIFLTVACGFHIRNATVIPDIFKHINYDSEDPYGAFSRSLKQAFRFNNIIANDKTLDPKLPSLRITQYDFTKKAVSIYQDGTAAENQLTLTINALVTVPEHGNYPISVKIFRSFFDNPSQALGKSTEEDLIHTEMNNQAALQLINKLITVQINNAPSSS